MDKKKYRDNMDNSLSELELRLEGHKKVISLLHASRMSINEKKMWIMMLPYMSEKEIISLISILEREINDMTQLYIDVLNTNIIN